MSGHRICRCQKHPPTESVAVGDAVGDDPNFDPLCDPNNPRKITIEDINEARERIKNAIIYTPCVKSHISDILGMDIYFKQEIFQYTGSFKERGARNAILKLSPEKQKAGVIASSAGNHAQGIAYHANLLGVPAYVVMPVTSPLMKVEKCKKYKANVIMHGQGLSDAKTLALSMAREKRLTFINGYDHCDIISGQGSIALEILEQVPDLDAVVIPAGGGGMLAGMAVAFKSLKPSVKVIGVESERCPGMTESMKAGTRIKVKSRPSLAEGLAVEFIGVNAFENIKGTVDKCIAVTEEFIAVAMLRLIELEKVVTEGSAAVSLACILSGQMDEFKNKKVVCVLSGGNIDTTVLRRCLDRGLAAEGRLIKLKATLPDLPGKVTEFCADVNAVGVAIKDIFHERAWLFSDVYSVAVKLICETRDYQHSQELKTVLQQKYENIFFVDFPEGYIPPPIF